MARLLQLILLGRWAVEAARGQFAKEHEKRLKRVISCLHYRHSIQSGPAVRNP